MKTILVKPFRQVSHIGLVMVILLVLITSLPVPNFSKNTKQASVDPFGEKAMTQQTVSAADKVSAIEAVATIASTIDEQMAAEAYAIADAQAAKTSVAMSGSAIAKMPVAVTTSSAKKAGVQPYVVKSGDTLSGIATQFGVTTDSIKWSNGMSDADFVKPGQVLNVPTITGIFYTIKSGDSIEGIAAKYKSSAAMIIAQNDLAGESIQPGMKIIIPDGVIEEVIPVAPQTPSTRYVGGYAAPRYVSASSGPNRFPWGYCTWWVAHKRYIPWNGNAWQWYGNAIAYGRAVGRTPVAGAVMVTWESSVGHVAYVESVNGSSFTVSEMNYVGYGRVSYRTITTSQVPLIGFIY